MYGRKTHQEGECEMKGIEEAQNPFEQFSPLSQMSFDLTYEKYTVPDEHLD